MTALTGGRSPREWLAGRAVLVQGVNRDSFALASLLRSLGADVRVAGSEPAEDALDDASPAAGAKPAMPNAGAEGSDYDVLFVDPVTFPAPWTPEIADARRRGRTVSTLADLVLQLSPVASIGVTGSGGKSSTTNLIAQLLTAAGIEAYATRSNERANMWPNHEQLERLAEMRPPGRLVAELTSSHLEYMHASPEIAVLTSFWPDHVEWHGSLVGYAEAKARILVYQSERGWAILNADDATRATFGPRCRGEVALFSTRGEVERGVYLCGEEIVARWDGPSETIGAASETPVPRPYLGNALAACAAALAAGVPARAIAGALPRLTGLAQRFELVAELDGVRVVDDGLAVTPAKALAALEPFPPRSLVLVAGGATEAFFSDALYSSAEEGALLASAGRLAAEKARAVVLFGPGGGRLRECLAAGGAVPPHVAEAPDVWSAAETALALARPGETVLFAPILFVGREEGRAFRDAVAAAEPRRRGRRAPSTPERPGA